MSEVKRRHLIYSNFSIMLERMRQKVVSAQ